MDARAWQDVQEQLEYASAVAGIRKGLDDVSAGRGVPASSFFAEFEARVR